MRSLGLLLAVWCAYGADSYTAAERRHWAFQPRKQVVAKSIDDLVKPAGKPADRRTLIRRVYFDLTGLPPTPEELDTKDPWPKIVEKLLDSPAYAEQWARHWLDVVRFAESDGYEYDTHRAEAWRYRDYVIDSIRKDKPYDQFLREQLGRRDRPEERRTACSRRV